MKRSQLAAIAMKRRGTYSYATKRKYTPAGLLDNTAGVSSPTIAGYRYFGNRFASLPELKEEAWQEHMSGLGDVIQDPHERKSVFRINRRSYGGDLLGDVPPLGYGGTGGSYVDYDVTTKKPVITSTGREASKGFRGLFNYATLLQDLRKTSGDAYGP